MSFIGRFLTKDAKVFNIDRTGSTPTGQPIEVVTEIATIKVSFNPKQRRDFGLFNPGQVTLGQFFALGESELIVPNQLLEIEGVTFRVTAVNSSEFQNGKTYFFKYWMDLFEHD